MKHLGKRAIAALLALIFMVGLFPTAAFATDDTGAAVEQVHSHVWGDWYTTAEPSCTEAGVSMRECSECGATETAPIAALGHAWGEWTELSAANCTEAGSREHSCTVCGETVSEVVPAWGHAWGEWTELSTANCTEAGSHEHTCATCGETVVEAIPALGHTWGEWTVTAEPNCTDKGSREHTCSVCGVTEAEAIPALGHTWGEWTELTAPTCTEEGSHEHTCSVCGVTVEEAIPALGHDWDEWVVTKEPTCEEKGEHEHVCKVCGEKETEEIEAKGHDWTEDNGVDLVKCKVCGILKLVADGGSFDLEFDDDRWMIAGDPSANVEDYTIWNAMFQNVELTGVWADDLLTIAQTQLGYQESTANFALSMHSGRNGYTRYGAWYGIPYGDWCAMFISFCMSYAGISSEDMPYDSGCAHWVETLNQIGRFGWNGSYDPKPGDLIFYDDGDGLSDHVGIVHWIDAYNGVIHTIEGNLYDRVSYREISRYDLSILGYGILPENPDQGADQEIEREQRTLSKNAGGRTITVSGLLPKDAELSVVAIPLGVAEEILLAQAGKSETEMKVVVAFDVSILSGGKKFDLEEYGESVTVSVSDVAEEIADVVHVKIDVTDGNGSLDLDSLKAAMSQKQDTEILGAGAAEDGTVFFDLTSCSMIALRATSVVWPDDLIARAEKLYNDETGEETPVQVYVNSPAGSTHQAGDTLTYKIQYLLATAANWAGDPYSGTEPLYDNYKNAYLEIKLPAGLLLQDAELEIASASPNDRDLTKEHTYRLKLSDVKDPTTGNYTVPSSSQPSSCEINVFIGNNGTANAINTYGTNVEGNLLLQNMVTLHAEFDVVNKLLPPTDPNYVVAHYSKTATSDGKGFNTTSPDVWGVVKANAANSPSYSLNTNPKTVTFTWEIGVGLLESDGKTVITDPARYTRFGRDAVTSMTLKDTLSAVFSKGGSSVDPMTVKIQKEGGSEVTITDKIGQELNVWGQDADPALTLATQQNPYIDSDGDAHGDQNPPIYTKYTVTATYVITDDMIADFHESVYNITAKNEADTKATLAKIPNVQEGHGEDSKLAPLVANTPASLQISKTLRKYGGKGTTGRDVPYTGTNVIYGTVTYTLTAADGKSFTVYKYNSSSSSYEEFSTGTSATLTAGDVYYLDTGRDFYVTENIDPDHANEMKFVSVTPADSADPTRAKFTATASQEPLAIQFLNKECKGYILINKNDGNPAHPLKDAAFTLTPAGGSEEDAITVYTNINGIAEYDNLPYGTYTLAEKSAPAGYVKQDDDNFLPKTIIIGDGNGENEKIKHEFTFKNLETKRKLELVKSVGITEALTKDFDQVTLTGGKEFPATFTLYREDANGVVTKVEKDYTGTTDVPTKLNAEGKISVEVPAADDNGAFKYFFKEELTEAGAAIYYPLNAPGATTQESERKTLTAGAPTTINMYNRQYVTIQLFKNFYDYNTDGSEHFIDDSSVKASLSVYRSVGEAAHESDLELVETKLVGKDAVNWEKLPVFNSSGNRYTYYVKETPVANYTLDTSYNNQDGTFVKIDGKDYVKIVFDTSADTKQLTYKSLLKNYLQAIPIHVIKYNSLAKNNLLAGCKVTIYKNAACTEVATDINGVELRDVELPTGATGKVILLKEGQKYYYKETDTNGFKFVSVTSDGTPAVVTDQNTPGVIDLTGNAQPATSASNVKFKSYTVSNKNDPELKLQKKTMVGGNDRTGAKFTVYIKNAQGQYVPYEDAAGNNVVFDMSSVSVLSKTIPEGTYYIAETTTPSGYISPNSPAALAEYKRMLDKYGREGKDDYFYDAIAKLTFRPVTVTEENSPNTFTFFNILNSQTLEVQKTVYGVNQKTEGFSVTVTGSDGTKKTVKTNDQGVASFTGLAIFNSNGEKITYTITEDDPSKWDGGANGTLAKTFYKVKDGQIAVLSGGDKVTMDTSGVKLTVDNARYIKVSATKFRQNGYMSMHGVDIAYTMDGVTIGLYRRLEGETTWQPVLDSSNQPITGETAQGGNISFDKLPRADAAGKKYEYALVELNSNSSVYLPYQGGFVSTPTAGASLTDLSPYNAVTLDASDIVNTKDEYKLDDLMNSSHWVQFHVTKFLDDKSLSQNLEALADDPTLKIDPDTGHSMVIDSKDTPLSDCIFSLYRHVLTDAEIEDRSVSFSAGSWTHIGTYSSGTLLNANDQILAGQFLTDIDEGVTDENGNVVSGVNERYVYMLVEDSVGPNSAIPNPYFQYTFWHCNGTTVTCPQASQSLTYKLDQVNDGEVLNSWKEDPGDANILLAALRLSKWADEPDDDGSMIYKPLENAFFEVRLPNGALIAELTSSRGVDPRKPFAYAQTGVFQLVFDDNKTPDDPDDDKVWMREYEVEGGTPKDYDVTSIVVEKDVTIGSGTAKVYLVPVSVREVGAPEGYGFSMILYDTYMVFCDKDPNAVQQTYRFFSDLFLTKSDVRDDFELAEDLEGTRYYYATDGDAGSNIVIKDHNPLRIVDRLTVNTPVAIHKVGYTPTVATMTGGKDGAPLDSEAIATGNYGATGLYGVTMTLERKDDKGAWKPWDPTAGTEGNWGTTAFTFSTNIDGDASFTNGLPQGEYRIIETGLGTNSSYENAYPNENRCRTFTVDPVPLVVYMANPTKFDLSIQKKDLDGKQLGAGFTFDLNGVQKTTSDGGVATWSGLTTGSYKLSETAAPSGYSTRYFAQLFAEKYPDLANLVNGTGMNLGYTYEVVDGDVVIKKITPWDSSENKIRVLEAKNPPIAKVNFVKIDKVTNTPMRNVKFTVFYRPFESIEGQYSLTLPAAKPTVEETLAQFPTTTFTEQDFSGGKWLPQTRTTNGSGTFNLAGGDPGIYVFVETGTLNGYEILKDDNGNIVMHCVVAACGLPITGVSVTPAKTTVGGKDYDTLFYSLDSTTPIPVSVPNLPMATLKAAKVAKTGMLTGTDVKNWSVTLNLYDAATGGNKVGTITIPKNNSATNVYFKDPNDSSKNAYFSLGNFPGGKKYYLEEVVSGDVDEDTFLIVSYQVGNGTVIPVKPGSRYEVPVDSVEGFTITVTNQYLYGKVDFVKRNSADHADLRKGAVFEVRHFVLDKEHPEDLSKAKWEPITGAEITDHEDGSYSAFFPLDVPDPFDSTKLITYRIYEKSPPPGFVMDPDPEKTYIEVQLSADNNYVNYTASEKNKETIYNTEGVKLNLLKYDNIHGATTISAADSNAKFAVYKWENNAWKEVQNEWVDNNGKMPEFVMEPFKIYAIAEVNFNHNDYTGFDGYYQDGVKLPLQPLDGLTDELGAPLYGVIFDGGDGHGVTKPISLVAYNVPKVSPKIEKKDVGKYPTGVYAMADFSIYEVPADFVANRANVEAFLNPADPTPKPTAVFTGSTTGQVTFADGLLGSTATWNSDKLEERWNPAKTYLIVETGVAGSGGTYDTMVKDDERVHWFVKTEPVANPDPKDPPVWTLENINGVADVTLTKTSDVSSVDSLLSGDRNVVYTLTPAVTGKNQMLTSFVLAERGITAEPARATFDYSITDVTIGGATQNVKPLKQPDGTSLDAEIKATITYYSEFIAVDAANENALVAPSAAKLGEETVVVTGASQSVTAPTGTKSFTIRYFSEEVQAARPGYDLGEELNVSPTTVAVTVKQIPKGEYGSPSVEITDFTNFSQVELHYPKWGADGSEPKDQREYDPAEAKVNVGKIKLPTVTIKKSDNLEGKAARTGTMVQYTLTYTNTSPTEVFKDPVLVDILPTGVKFKFDPPTYPVTPGTGTQGEIMTLDPANIFTVEGDIKQQVETPTGLYGDPETAVIFKLDGTLKPGSSAKLTFWAEVTASALLYTREVSEPDGTVTTLKKIRNDVYLSSSYQSYFTEDNPHGYSFAVSTGPSSYEWGKILPVAAQDPNDPSPAIHEAGVHSDVLDLLKDKDQIRYAFVRAADILDVVQGATLGLSKGVWGDRDDGFHDKDVGWCTRTVLYEDEQGYEKGDQGWAKWRLTVNNGETQAATDLVIGDVIPKYGDDDNRKSSWNVYFDSFETVKANNKELVAGTDYTVWYYTGGQTSSDGTIPAGGWTYEAKARVKADLPHAREEGYLASKGWTTTLPDTIQGRGGITAFIMVFGEKGDLPGGHSMVVTYHTIVEKVSEQRFTEIAFTNATNDFWLYYKELYPLSPINSNPVDVSLMDQLVQVEGDVWIDEDWDGTQEEGSNLDGNTQIGGNRRNYSEYAIINQLANSISFIINDKSGSGTSTDPENADHGSNTKPGYGESIRHFVFTDLFPAKHMEGIDLYINEELNVDSLKGKDPARYVINAAISTASLLDIFKLTDLGTGHYMSDDPDTELSASAANSLDSNFFESGTTTFTTKPFFIRYSNLWDQSKDIGFKMVRDLEITKVAADDSDSKIAGAKFSIYGPYKDTGLGYADGTLEKNATSAALKFSGSNGVYALDPKGTVTVLETDANGKLTVTGLNWWKEYKIEEVDAPEAYKPISITATGDSSAYTQVSPVKDSETGETSKTSFWLRVPGKQKVNKIDKVIVSNVRSVDVKLNVWKLYESFSEDKYTFHFELRLTDVKPSTNTQNTALMALDPIEELDIEVQGDKDIGKTYTLGTFGNDPDKPLTLNGVGIYTFMINETETVDTNWHGTFDTNREQTVTVTVVWDAANSQLKVDSIVYHDPSYTDGTDTGALFTNKYNPEPAKVEIPVKKTLAGNDPPEDMTFNFMLTGKNNAPMPAGEGNKASITIPAYSAPAARTALESKFGEIEYVKTGTYEYTITEEQTPKIKNVTYSTLTYDVTVTVTDADKDGKLEAVYAFKNGGAAATDALFTNTYTPTPVELVIPVKKVISGGTVPSTKEKFRFTIEASSTGAPLPNPAFVEVTGAAAENEGSFGNIKYTEAGTYVYIVREARGSNNHYSYDMSYWTVTVKVEDVDNELKVTEYTVQKTEITTDATATETNSVTKDAVSIKGDALKAMHDSNNVCTLTDDSIKVVFTNPYTPEPVKLKIPVKKLVTLTTGSKEPDAIFTFDLVAKDGAPMPVVNDQTITKDTVVFHWPADKDKTIEFHEITFREAGTYKYTVTEQEPDPRIPGVTYDTTPKNVTVTVTVGADDKLIVHYTVEGVTGEDKPVEITNKFDEPKVDVEVEKIWDDDDDQDAIRPRSITVTLKRSYTKTDGTEVKDEVVTFAQGDTNKNPVDITKTIKVVDGKDVEVWEYKWEDLPKYYDMTQLITYSVTEAKIEAPAGFQNGYADTYAVEPKNPTPETTKFSIKITNTHEPERIDFEFTKVGEDVPAEGSTATTSTYSPLAGVEFTLYTDEACTTIATKPDVNGNPVELKAVSAPTTGVVKFEKIPMYKVTTAEDGTETKEPMVYYMKETNLGDANKDLYWDNSTIYKLEVVPKTATAPAKIVMTEVPAATTATGDGSATTGGDGTGSTGNTTAGGDGTGSTGSTPTGDGSATTGDGSAATGDNTAAAEKPEPIRTGKLVSTTVDGKLAYTIQNDLVKYKVKLLKKDEKDKTPLAKAEFALYHKGDLEKVTTDGKTEWKPKDGAKAVKTNIVTDAKGEAELGWISRDGKLWLLPGEYELLETKAPDGYFPIEDPISIKIEKGKASYQQPGADKATELTLENVASFTVEVTNKPKYGDLRIRKYLDTFEMSEDATFVFTVKGELDGKVVYSNVAVLTISKENPTGVLDTILQHIPAGAKVTVTEEYTGSHYELVAKEMETDTIVANRTISVNFTNTYNYEDNGGHGLANVFKPNTDGGWTHDGVITRTSTPTNPKPLDDYIPEAGPSENSQEASGAEEG